MQNPEYRNSRERFGFLHDLMVDAADAKAVKKYADVFVATAIDKLLGVAASGGSDVKLVDAAYEYRAALEFQELLDEAIKKGEEKEDAYVRLKGNK